jgi:ubiquinone biosynthesis protein
MRLLLNPLLWLRFVRIVLVLLSLVLHRGFSKGLLGKIALLNPKSWYAKRGVCLRKDLIKLGPIFVKFGQTLSTRRDILPADIADELAKLQDKVPAFSGRQAKKIIESSLGGKVETLFKEFSIKPLASASIAQVHAATLDSGEHVVVKVLRPSIRKTIKSDLLLMRYCARMLTTISGFARHLRLREIVSEFSGIINLELDLQSEAANCSQMARNFAGSDELKIPKIYWKYCKRNVMVSEKITAVPVLQVPNKKGFDTKKIANSIVEIFFTQVFRDSFFHADMHPGNIFVEQSGAQKIALVDFGIVGILNASDQHYLAANLLAFFKCDYRKVAELHVQSGWVPSTVRIDKLEAAIRADCEPIFAQALHKVSFADFLLRLFRTAERFDMVVQPQLLLLQKTLLNVEGLGRYLDPSLDLWAAAEPILKKFVKRERSLQTRLKTSLRALPDNLEALTDLPVLLNSFLQQQSPAVPVTKTKNRFVLGLVCGAVLAAIVFFVAG